MSIGVTRAAVDAILSGSIQDADFTTDPVFGFEVPMVLPGVDPKVLQPREAWSDAAAYDETLVKLARLYAINFEQYAAGDGAKVAAFGPQVTVTQEQRAELSRLVAAEK